MKKTLSLVAGLAAAATMVSAQEATGSQSDFRTWASTPPMGWNSWDCYGPTVREDEVKASADYMAEELHECGWEYIIVDIRWFVANTKRHGYNEKDPVYVVDEYGRYQPAENRFPSSALGQGFKPLADYVHSKGLKFGIHIMRGIPKVAVARRTPVLGADGITADMIASTDNLCEWLHDNLTVDASKPGAQEYYNSIFDLYASWGVDYIKIDDLSAPYYHEDEIDLIRKAIDQCGRPIVLSTSPGETPLENASHIDSTANMWRMVNDVWDKWDDLTHLMEVASGWYPYIGEGTWPDCDMIPLGRLSIRGERGEDRMTLLTEDEQVSLMTFFSILRSPLMFGGDLMSMDEFTKSLLTNEDVLRMHRLGDDVREVFQNEGSLVVTSVDSGNGDVYVALFNKGGDDATVTASFRDLGSKGLRGTYEGKNLWTGEMKSFRKDVATTLAPHSCALWRLSSK